MAYGSGLAVAGALKLGELVGVELSAEVLAAVATVSAFVITETIQRLVYSPQTTQAIADRAADTGDTDIGNPPAGPTG